MTACMVAERTSPGCRRLSFVQDSRRQPRASSRKHGMTSSVKMSGVCAARNSTQRIRISIANLELCSVFSVKSLSYWNKMGRAVPLSWLTLGHLGHLKLHTAPPAEGLKSHHYSRGRATGWLRPLFPARSSGSSCQGDTNLPCRRRALSISSAASSK